MEKENQENWEKEFEEIFGFLKDENPQLKEAFKNFIRKTLEEGKKIWREENKKEIEGLRTVLAHRFLGKSFSDLSVEEMSAIIVLSEAIKEEEEKREKK